MGKEKLTPEQQREKSREFLKAHGKDPDKLLPKTGKPTPESENAGAASSAGKPKEPDLKAIEEQKEKERHATEAKTKAEEKRILEAKEEDLNDDDKKKKKEILVLQREEKEAKREANTQKRIDHLIGAVKALKAEKIQDKEQIKALDAELKNLQGKVEAKPNKVHQEVQKLENDRIAKALEEDKSLPREQRREMTKDELNEWMIEDLVAAQEWLTDRNIRRKDERQEDSNKMTKEKEHESVKQRAETVVKAQREAQERVAKRHPELDASKRIKELKDSGKTPEQIKAIVFKENPKLRVMAEILSESGAHEKYSFVADGPELLEKEMLRRMSGGKAVVEDDDFDLETTAEREERIANEAAEEAAEAERQRQEQVETGLNSSGNRSIEDGDPDADIKKSPLFSKQLVIWKKQFPKLSEAEVTKRLVKRLKARGETVVS